MHSYVEALLLNMLFLVVFLLFIPHLIETNIKHLSSKQKKLIKLASVIVAMICCMSFPFRIGDEIFMDLRTVTLLFGALYLGKSACIILVSLFLIFRLYVAGGFGSGFYAALLTSTLFIILLIPVINVFERAKKSKRIMIACSFSLFLSMTIIFIRLLFHHLNSSDTMAVITFTIIHLLSTFFIFYFYEMMQESEHVNKQVIKAEKLEVVSQLASSISHEVRNPLTVVKGFLQMLNQKGLEEDKKNKFIEISLQEIDRANDVIGNYLTFAKSAEEELTTIDLKQELNRAVDVITPMANMNCVDIETKLQSCYIKGDAQLLQQCFLNITKNCIEAMPDGGSLYIGTEKVDGGIVVEIKDTGAGMTKEQLGRIGEPFYTTKGREGTGLGMMAVLKIIHMLNGKLNVTSNINEGTQFSVYFPCVKDVNKISEGM